MKHYSLVFILIVTVLASCTDQNEIKPQRKDIVDAVFGSGHIENKDQYAVTANTDGYLKESYVAEGDTVKPGEKLFRLTNDVQQTQVVNALTNLQYAQSNVQPRSPQIEQLKIQMQQRQMKFNEQNQQQEGARKDRKLDLEEERNSLEKEKIKQQKKKGATSKQ